MQKTQYVPPFDLIKRELGSGWEAGKIEIDFDIFMQIIQRYLHGFAVDEDWYLKTYPDIREAINSGDIKSAKDHFVANGYFEGRRPGPIEVDAAWYLTTYPDVQEGLSTGLISSAQDHFDHYGYAEGRAPRSFK